MIVRMRLRHPQVPPRRPVGPIDRIQQPAAVREPSYTEWRDTGLDAVRLQRDGVESPLDPVEGL
ncbi:hypothetical protein [Sorangium sp. So ce1000]|uniref:hypothetical protein n=1 Tax=Sorangium sp. So ce1000 TaxID=3133325 RepID=UPI003F601569